MQITRHDAGRRRHGNARVDSPFQPGDPHHVELVEIGREDRQELGALEQRDTLGVLREIQHAVVECEPAQFTVGIASFGKLFDGWSLSLQ